MSFHQIEFSKMPQPDKLFRDSLEHYNKPAPVSAWNRIETSMDSRQPKRIWLKIAAGLLLLVAAAFLLWPHDKINQATTLYQKETKLPERDIAPPMSTITPSPQISASSEMTSVPNPKSKMGSPSGRKISKGNTDVVDVVKAQTGNSALNNDITSTEQTEEISIATPVIKEESLPLSSEENTVLHKAHANIFYTSAEINARFMKKNLSKEATPEKKPASGIKKVITIAMDLKNDDKIYGDLRQIKNELLTFNFPDKKRDPTK